MTPQQVNELHQQNNDLRQENTKLKDDLIYAKAKEKELRDIISYLNKLGPKPL